MVVMGVIEEMLVAGNTVGEVDLASQTAFGQDFHRSVNGGVADTRIESLHTPVDVFDTPVAFVVQKCFKNEFAMRRDLQVSFSKVIGKNLRLGSGGLHGLAGVEPTHFTTSL